MTIVFDFDYTLFDAGRFKEALAAALQVCGVSREVFLETYAGSSQSSGSFCDYDPEEHVATIGDRLHCDRDEALRLINSIVDRAAELVFPGTAALLDLLRRDGHRLVLLTHGNVAWQEKKVVSSGLAEKFDQLIFTPKEKEREFGALSALERPVVMVNDNGLEIDALQEAFPEFKMIAVKGPKPSPTDQKVPVCAKLEEVYEIIRKTSL